MTSYRQRTIRANGQTLNAVQHRSWQLGQREMTDLLLLKLLAQLCETSDGNFRHPVIILNHS
jgi:hypothetical protein